MSTPGLKFISLALAILLGSLSTAPAQDKTQCLAIIVNKSNKLEDITMAIMKKYFTAEKTRTPNGLKLVIVMADVGRPERDAALKVIYGMNETEYNDFFVGQTFTGAVAAAPKSLPSPAAIKQYVAQTPGAIGYIRASDVDDSVIVVKIAGKAPGDAGYALTM